MTAIKASCALTSFELGECCRKQYIGNRWCERVSAILRLSPTSNPVQSSERFAAAGGIKIVPVHYRGAAPHLEKPQTGMPGNLWWETIYKIKTPKPLVGNGFP